MPHPLAATVLLFTWTAGGALAAEGPVPVSAEAARAAFERIQALAGRWRGSSTRGWTDTIRVRVIARGSAVVMDAGGAAEGGAGAHPGEEMMTVFYLDHGRLMLTHYCVARNHPRLVAVSAEGGGRVLEFRFVDGANLASRDVGHMDSMVMRIDAPDRFTSRWTWHAGGVSQWTEEIERVRLPGGAP
jgi:hypothetical protein